MSIKGKVWKYGDDVNTDVIFPGKYTYTITDPKEMATHALEVKYAGVGVIVAKSFARIFFRNAINQGLPLVQCKEAVENIFSGETITIDFEKGKLSCKKGIFNFP
jgi:3-isopropylmalate/(R)-2-methylmalate dehydratase small subunit